ncbi:MAG: DUF4214 domain-containing protein [Acidimicrobiales bacterium]
MTTTRLPRLLAAALLGLLAAVGFGVAPASAAAVPPDPPRLPPAPAPALRIVDGCTLQVDWAAAPTGEPATSYVINLWSLPRVDNIYGIPIDLQQRVVPAPTTDYRWTGLLQDKRYNVTVAAQNPWGNSADTVLGAIGPHPSPPASCTSSGPPSPTRPFAPGDGDAVIVRSYKDFLGRPPTSAELATERNGIVGGFPDDLTLLARRTDLAGRLEAVAEAFDGPAFRLYSAYFRRDPELAGLQFWSSKIQSGTSIRTVSAGFADSSEFRNTYGTLDDTEFVNLVYRNVLGRKPDAGGLRFWVAQLRTGRNSRAGVMAGFSESSEHVRRLSYRVTTTVAYVHMLGRMPTAAEHEAAALFSRQHDGAPASTWFRSLHWTIVDSREYVARGTNP